MDKKLFKKINLNRNALEIKNFTSKSGYINFKLMLIYSVDTEDYVKEGFYMINVRAWLQFFFTLQI